MEQRDYILREIEKISVLIAGMLGRLRSIETRRQFEEARAMIDDDLSGVAALTINDLLETGEHDLIARLKEIDGMNFQNLEQLAILLVAFSSGCPVEERTVLLMRAAALIRYIDNESKTFSFERASLLENIDGQIAAGE